MLRKKGRSYTRVTSGTGDSPWEIGKQLVFVTNNSTKSRADYKKKFDGMGISANEVRSRPTEIHALRYGQTKIHPSRTKSSAPPTAPQSTSRASSNSNRPRTKSTSSAKAAWSKSLTAKTYPTAAAQTLYFAERCCRSISRTSQMANSWTMTWGLS